MNRSRITSTSPPPWLRVIAGAGMAALVATTLSLVVLGIPLMHVRSPWGTGDLLSTAVNVEYWRGLAYTVTTDAGYPFGMNLNLVSALDITGNCVAAVIAYFTGSAFAGVNLLLALSFPAVAAATYLVLRMVGLTRTTQGAVLAIAMSAAYAVIPYHWARGLGHVYLATLLPGVVTVALALLVGRGDLRQWLRPPSTRARAIRMALLVAMTAVCALSGLYAAAFAVLLVGAAALWQLLRAPSPVTRALPVLLVPLGIVLIASCAALPTLLARRDTVLLAELGSRDPAESVTFAGSLLLAAVPLALLTYGARIPGVRGIHEHLTGMLSDLPELESTSMGAFGTVVTAAALVVLVIGSLLALRAPRPWSGQLRVVWVLMITAGLAFVPWGLGAFVALTVTTQVRAWNRLLPILLLLVLVGAAAVMGYLHSSSHLRKPWSDKPWSSQSWSTVLVAAVAAIVIAVALVESVLPFRAPYLRSLERAETLQQAAEQYATAVNRAIPGNCAILQLPYVAYPEQGVIEPRLNDYEHFWQVLTNPDKQWSYGAVRNTVSSSWAAALPQLPSPSQQATLAQAGFCAIHLDRRGYRPPAWRAMSETLNAELGPPVATGLQGRWQLYALTNRDAANTVTSKKVTSEKVTTIKLSGDPKSWPPQVRALFLAPALLDSDLGPRRTRLTSSWYQLDGAVRRADIVAVDAAVPVTGVSGWVQAPSCGPVQVRVSLGEASVGPLVARPGQVVPFSIKIPASERAQLTIRAQGPVCADPPGFTPWIVRIGDLVPTVGAGEQGEPNGPNG